MSDEIYSLLGNPGLAGQTVEMKLQLEPSHRALPSGLSVKRSSSGQKPGCQLFCMIEDGHIWLHITDFGPPGARVLKNCCADPIIAWMDEHRAETDSEGEEREDSCPADDGKKSL